MDHHRGVTPTWLSGRFSSPLSPIRELWALPCIGNVPSRSACRLIRPEPRSRGQGGGAAPPDGDRGGLMTCPRCKKDSLRHHSRAERGRRWVTTRCAECGWVDTTSWV